jgi:hypothetical protein
LEEEEEEEEPMASEDGVRNVDVIFIVIFM